MEAVNMLSLVAKQNGSWNLKWQAEKSRGELQLKGGKSTLRLFREVVNKLEKEDRELWLTITLPLSLFSDLCEIIENRLAPV